MIDREEALGTLLGSHVAKATKPLLIYLHMISMVLFEFSQFLLLFGNLSQERVGQGRDRALSRPSKDGLRNEKMKRSVRERIP